MTFFKAIVITLIGLLLLVVILQNTAPVQTTVLFATITMPRAVLLLLMLLAGFALGILTALLLVDKGRAQGRPDTPEPPPRPLP